MHLLLKKYLWISLTSVQPSKWLVWDEFHNGRGGVIAYTWQLTLKAPQRLQRFVSPGSELFLSFLRKNICCLMVVDGFSCSFCNKSQFFSVVFLVFLMVSQFLSHGSTLGLFLMVSRRESRRCAALAVPCGSVSARPEGLAVNGGGHRWRKPNESRWLMETIPRWHR